MKKVKKILFIVLGCIGLALGAVGAVLPLMPAFPFLLLAAVCFAKSSEKLHNWFINTKLYKKNLESFVKGKGMTWKVKIRIMSVVTVLMAIGCVMMMRVPIGQIVLGCVWLFHILFFIFGIKTMKKEEEEQESIKEKLPEIAKNAIGDACTGSNPRIPTQEEMEKLFTAIYYGEDVDF